MDSSKSSLADPTYEFVTKSVGPFSQLLLMTLPRKSQAIPTVCHRVQCWAQFSSFSTQNLSLTWLDSVSLYWVSVFLWTILSSKFLSLHQTFNLQYLLWKSVSQISRLVCWKTSLIGQRASSCVHLRGTFQYFSKPTTTSLCGCVVWFSFSAIYFGLYITDDMSVELYMKNVCRSVYSQLRLYQHSSASSFQGC